MNNMAVTNKKKPANFLDHHITYTIHYKLIVM
jgi:hypothetical protein